MLQLLDIDMHLDPKQVTDDYNFKETNYWARLDRNYLLPFFTRMRRPRLSDEAESFELEHQELSEWSEKDKELPSRGSYSYSEDVELDIKHKDLKEDSTEYLKMEDVTIK